MKQACLIIENTYKIAYVSSIRPKQEKHSRMKTYLLSIFLVLSLSSYAQVDREFWFAIPKETWGHPGSGTGIDAANNVSFKIAAMSLDAKVTISMPANPSFTKREFTVLAGKSRIEVMATSFAEFETVYANNTVTNSLELSGYSNKGILIQSDNDISVYYDLANPFNTELHIKGEIIPP